MLRLILPFLLAFAALPLRADVAIKEVVSPGGMRWRYGSAAALRSSLRKSVARRI